MTNATRQPYTVHMNYTATGEGSREYISVLLADDEAKALTSFRVQHRLAAYFALGVDVRVGIDRDLLSRFLTARFLDALELRLQHNGVLHFSWSLNMS